MINFTPLSKPLMASVYSAEVRARADMEGSQRRTLRKLLDYAAPTEWARNAGVGKGTTYVEFADRVAPADYEAIRPYVERMLRGEANVLVPGVVTRYAQSSGTSGSKSKYIPLPQRSLHNCHYAGAAFALASYLHYYPQSRVFGGKNFILGGSYANEIQGLSPRVKVGDLSASLIDRINPLVNLFRIPGKHTALLADWREKLPKLVEASKNADVRSISGVPSWFLTVLKEVIASRGAQTIHDVWPNLEVFFHGGIAFSPYREQYAAITDPARMRYWENYNASEGFFAVQERPDAPDMGLLMNADVFYEFIPVDTSVTPDGASAAGARRPEEARRPAEAPGLRGLPVAAWEVEVGKVYELVITSSNGLYRYRIGDTVEVTSLSPLTIRIAGRTRSFINAFGEELMVHNADAAISRAMAATGSEVRDYTAAPVYAGDATRGRHQWFVEFAREPQGGIEAFARELDAALQQVNSDYQAKRAGSIFLDPPDVIAVPRGLFDRWLEQTGRLGGQRKVPRLSNDRRVADALLTLLSETNSDNTLRHENQ